MLDGHVEVARLLLDSGAQVNMPADSFESPLTLAACGGHVELAMLLLERGANIEEVGILFTKKGKIPTDLQSKAIMSCNRKEM